MILKIRIICIIFLVTILFHCNALTIYDSKSALIEEINKGLEKISLIHHVELLDTYSIFLGTDGKANQFYYADDGLHLCKEGYIQWVNKSLLPFISCHSYQKIAMVGNSITAGIERYRFGKEDSLISNWEYLLNKKVINSGVAGNTSNDVINRLDQVLSDKADCYFLLIGINDIKMKIPVWKTLENIETIVLYFKKNNTDMVLQKVMPVIE